MEEQSESLEDASPRPAGQSGHPDSSRANDAGSDNGKTKGGSGMIDRLTIAFIVLGIIAAGALTMRSGAEATTNTVSGSVFLAIKLLPQIAVGLFLAALVSVMIPKDTVGKWLGEKSGIKGLIGATIIGAIMPGGPFASFPLALAFIAAGADLGCIIAFLLAWGAIGLNRLLVWEVPFMGFDFAMLRFVCSLPAPILAGIAARRLVRHLPSLRPDIG